MSYLATGDLFTIISYSYRVGVSTVAHIVGAVSQAIWEHLLDDYMPVPSKQEWRTSLQVFWSDGTSKLSVDVNYMLVDMDVTVMVGPWPTLPLVKP
ncbi:Minor capsid protein VP2 [Labeo rohita]|uniref:Minor capsid protein VP2 n=1 Tax=Labeo rohita TaxID=84645 RepID=A0ABQ8L3X5_LABRO|nr:Minor capsid protein VP2 [Labeo rohita]